MSKPFGFKTLRDSAGPATFGISHETVWLQVEGALTMEFCFTISIEGHGARDVAEDNCMALLDAFERTHPKAGAAVGADLVHGVLEVTFCASGNSLEVAAEDASQIFIEAAVASGLEPADLLGFEVEANLAAPRRVHSSGQRTRGPKTWAIPQLFQAAG